MNNQTSSASDSSNFDSEDSDTGTGFDLDENDSDGGNGSDSDEEPDDDEEDSDEANVDLLVAQVESDFLDLLDNIVSKVEQQQDVPIQSSSQGVRVLRVISSSRKDVKEEGTQTDSLSSSVALSKDPLPDHDSIREEIEFLRQARESLVLQRKEVADKVKQKSRSSEDFEADQKKVYEFEEAIEAIDLVVEFKNETLCGRDCIMSNCLAPGTHEADLVTRLSKLSMLDLQRLLCKYFSKMTEFRYTSRQLEKQCEESENLIKSLKEDLRFSKKLTKVQTEEFEKRFQHLLDLQGKHPTDLVAEYVKTSEHRILESQKRQIDLGRCLNDLLKNCRFPGANDRLIEGILKKLPDLDINDDHTPKRKELPRSKLAGASSSQRNGSAKMPSSSKAHKSRFFPEFADSRRVVDQDKYRYSDKRRVGITDSMNGDHQEMLQRLVHHKSETSQFQRHHVSSPPPSSQSIVKRMKNRMIIQPGSAPES